MLTYINENFLHAPSTDLSREVVHLLIGVTMAQATEIFTEKLVDEKKAPALVSRSANSAAGMYAALVEEMKEFQGKGVFDRNWLYVLQIKARLFASLAQYYRSVADAAGGKHGAALVRMKMADTAAQDASRQASTFSYTFVGSATPSLPHDTASSLVEITKAHASLCSEAKVQATKDNDLIYHDILPSEASLTQIEKLPAAAPITIQEVYGNPDVSKLIGPDIFIRLIPLAVHESASVYSEEKAKLVRGEVERTELNEGEIRASLEHLGLPGLVSAWRRMTDDDEEGDGEVEVSSGVRRLAEEIQQSGATEPMLRNLDGERERCERELRELSGLLDNESRECERMRVSGSLCHAFVTPYQQSIDAWSQAKYAPQFTQSPSGPQTAHLRNNISSNLGSLQAASSSDAHISSLWREIQANAAVLSSGQDQLQRAASQVAAGKAAPAPAPGVSLLDLQEEVGAKGGLDEKEKEELRNAIADTQERLDRLGKVRKERDEVLKDLKEKVRRSSSPVALTLQIQNDDVSNLLLLNRRSQNVEPQLFATELEKFRPYQGRIAAAVQASSSIVQELEMVVRQVEKGKGVKERQRGQKDRQRRVREWERKLETAGEGYHEVRAGLSKGLAFYESLSGVINDLKREVKAFVGSRESERNRMVSEIETRQRLAGSPPPPPSAPGAGARGLDAQLAGLSLGGSSPYTTSPPPKPTSAYSPAPSLPPPPQQTSTPSFPPPPPAQPKSSNPYDFGSLSSLPSAFSTSSPIQSSPYSSAPPRPEPPTQHRQGSYGSAYPSQPNPYPPPPPQASRPAQPSYPYSGSQASYPAPPTQPTQLTQPYSIPPSSSYPAPPPPRSGSSSYYPAPPSQPTYSSPPPPPSQAPQHGYPAYPPPQGQQQQQYPPPQPQYGGYQSPPPQPPSQGYPGYQPQGGYPYR
jgi:hypothetical protein